MSLQRRLRSALRTTLLALLLVLALYLIGRAVVELATVDLGRPETYRQDWGGPSYLGVVLVHAGPGLVATLLAISYFRRRSCTKRGQHHAR